MTGQVLSVPLCMLLLFRVCLGLHGVAASSLIAFHDRALVSVATPFSKSSYVVLPFQRFSVQIPSRRSMCIFVHACALDAAHH